MDRRKYRKTVALMSMLSETKTIDNADIATFDGNGENLLSLIVGVEPVQDLHGYDVPWPAGGGKNKLPYATPIEIYGVNFTVASDGVVTLNGTPTAGLCDCYFVGGASGNYQLSGIPSGDYILSGGANGTSLYVVAEGGSIIAQATGTTNANVTIDSTTKYRIFLRAEVGVTFTNTKVYPMLRLSTISDATYSPYSNECPISGWTGANIHVSPTTDAADGDTHSITFPPEAGTVYGGTLNVTTGKLFVNRVLHSFTGDEPFILLTATDNYSRRFGVKLSNISGLPPVLTDDVICSHGVQKISTDANLYDFVADNNYISFYDFDSVYSTVSAFKANLAERYNSGNPVQACFFLKDPIVYDVDPVAIKTLVGQNNIWADTGKIIFLEYES